MAVALSTVRGNCGVALDDAAIFDAGVIAQGNWRSPSAGVPPSL
ncbi:hypothetical protein WKK05_39840 (plasmid) [Nostoc sp. UHCC 0302]